MNVAGAWFIHVFGEVAIVIKLCDFVQFETCQEIRLF